ncbi:hypothetical protein [Kutzneria sp. NPDC052558]|uniref:hypothetical protein n=1 Tax=Kutzneria sp. NPDC052558 TaxID=3364121 RepID=UPI0037CC777D
MTVNAALADILDRQAAEAEPERLLGALVDGGVFVPVLENGSVLFLKGKDGRPDLPGFVSEACCAEKLPAAAAAVHCDALRLLDIVGKTGVEVMSVHSGNGWARVPVPLVRQTLSDRGVKGTGQRLKLSWSTHPTAIALRDALVRRIREFPAIQAVWVSQARWVDTGMENLMLHVAVDEPLPSSSAQRMMEVLLREEVRLGDGDPKVSMLALDPTAHAATIAELETKGLDTIRLDAASGRVEVISREYDDPAVAENAEQGKPKRWWRRS